MPRKGKQTVAGTSIDKVFVDLIDEFIKKYRMPFLLRQVTLSRAKVLELALLKFLDDRGELESSLKALGLSSDDIQNIREYLKLVG